MIRISKKGKFANEFPVNVANRIREISSSYTRLKSLEIEDCDQTKTFYVGEGESYTGIKSDGEEVAFKVVSQNTIGAANVSHSIGEQFNMPPESYLVKISYYTRYFMTVYRVGRNENIIEQNETLTEQVVSLAQLEQAEDTPLKIIEAPYQYKGFEKYIFVNDNEEYFVRQETWKGIVDTPISEFYTRSFAVAHLHYNGVIRRSIDNNFHTELYLMCDGFGLIDYEKAIELCFDWSHVRDASYEAFERVCDMIAKRKGYYGGFQEKIELYKSKIAFALYCGKDIVNDLYVGDVKIC